MEAEYKKLMDSGRTDEAAKLMKANAKYFAAGKAVNSMSRTASSNMKLLGMGRDADIMKLINNHRKAMLDLIDK